jgi:hypothetical protein
MDKLREAKRRNSKVTTPFLTVKGVEREHAAKIDAHEAMCSPEFETAILAYLLNTNGAFSTKKSGSSLPTENVMQQGGKSGGGSNPCTWCTAKNAELLNMKKSGDENIRRLYPTFVKKQAILATAAQRTDREKAREILSKDKPYIKSMSSFFSSGEGTFTASASIAATTIGFDPSFF